jgi:AcrR family transcriptional regulator
VTVAVKKPATRLTSEERKAAIIKAVRQAFAEKGFHGTTTRELARAAGVSEALLFKHFPTKESLFAAMKLSCCSQRDVGRIERLKALEPSTSTLVLMVHFLVSHVIGQCGASKNEEQIAQQRLVLRSLAEDGEFARLMYGTLKTGWVSKVEQCVKAAIDSGDAVDGAIHPRMAAWLTHHLAAAVMYYRLPEVPAFDYGLSEEKLMQQAVWFALRGIGLREEAIRKHYNPKALALFER